MPSHSEGPGIWFSVWRFLLTHCLYERAAKVLARLRECAGSPEPSLLAFAISTKFAWRGPFEKCCFLWTNKAGHSSSICTISSCSSPQYWCTFLDSLNLCLLVWSRYVLVSIRHFVIPFLTSITVDSEDDRPYCMCISDFQWVNIQI